VARLRLLLLPMHSTYVSDDALLMLPIISDDDMFQETDQLLEHVLELPSVQYPQQQQQHICVSAVSPAATAAGHAAGACR
jgi:hypothetical protein